MMDAGRDGEGRPVLLVHEPQGWEHRFTETAPGQWTPPPSVRDRMVSEGGNFRVLRLDGGEVRFTRREDRRGAIFELSELFDPLGNTWKFGWESGRLTSVTEPAGRWLRISYQALSYPGATAGARAFTVISYVAASDGQVVTYEYEFPAGVDYPVLAGVTYPDAAHATYAYAAPRRGDRLLLTQVDDPRADGAVRGRTFYYRTEPDAAFGQILEIRAADGGGVMQSLAADPANPRGYLVRDDNGAVLYRSFNTCGNIAEETDALGFARKHDYDSGGRGFRTATTNALGHVTRFENDATGHVLKATSPDGSYKIWQRDARGRVLAETDELGLTRRYTRDERGRMTRVQHPDGSTEESTYNEFGQPVTRRERSGAVITMFYDERGLLTKTTNPLGAVTAYAYDARDRLVAITDAHSNNTRFERDAVGRVTKTTYADGTSTSTTYNAFGQATKNVDATGFARRMTYDNLGRLVATVDALGQETRTEYAPVGQAAPFNRPVRTISASGRATTMAYDAAGRMVARTTAAGTKEAATTRTAYDAAGRQSSATNPLGQTVQFFHDERGRRIKTMSALNHATTSTYDAAGRKLSETDPKGNTTQWTYDAMGRELTKTDAKGQATRREYDAAGRLVALIDAKLSTYRFEYDPLGRQTALVYPDGSRETTAYDAAGLRMRSINRAGTAQTFTYDNRNREISSEWSDGSQRIVKAYDPAGRMTLEDNGVSKLTFTYDAAGRLVSETQDLFPIVTGGAFDPAARTVSYTYNADGQRETLGYPDGSFVKFTYNARGQLADILSDGIPPPIASYEYDSAGNATLMPRANATETEREFDAENKTLAITERVAGRRSPLSELDYLYDEAGNRTATLATADADGRGARQASLDTYRYDETYQVTGANYAAPVQGNRVSAPAGTVRFSYDAVGNRLAVDENGAVTRYAVNNLNQYLQVGQFSPTHDRNGNLSGMGPWLYRYDAMNRLVFASNGQMTARFHYDAKNRCVARSYQAPGSALQASISRLTLNTYDNWNLLEERDDSGAQQARYVHGGRIDEVVVMVNRHGTFYPHHDALGNVTMLTGKDGRLVERYTYSVTGQVAISDGAGKTLSGSRVGSRWLFTGREWLQEVGLYDYRNRIYSAELGRFLQTDPVRFNLGDANIYQYARNSFINLTDPLGLKEDLNLFPPGSAIFNNANAGSTTPGVYTVGAHGDANGIVDANGSSISAANLAGLIQSDPNYTLGTPVRLDSCQVCNGTFPQALSTALGGTQVSAPDKYVWYYPDGSTTVAGANNNDPAQGINPNDPGSYFDTGPQGFWDQAGAFFGAIWDWVTTVFE